MVHRFFVPSETISHGQVRFSPEQGQQLRHVLRLQEGGIVTVLDGEGQGYEVAVSFRGKKETIGRIMRGYPAGNEPAGVLTLCLAIARAERFEWVLQKGTELGVTNFQPMITRRTVRKQPGHSKWERWHRIIRELQNNVGVDAYRNSHSRRFFLKWWRTIRDLP